MAKTRRSSGHHPDGDSVDHYILDDSIGDGCSVQAPRRSLDFEKYWIPEVDIQARCLGCLEVDGQARISWEG